MRDSHINGDFLIMPSGYDLSKRHFEDFQGGDELSNDLSNVMQAAE